MEAFYDQLRVDEVESQEEELTPIMREDALDRTEALVNKLMDATQATDTGPLPLVDRVIRKKQFVYTQFVKEGYHAFPEAASDPRYATGDKMDVSHLGTRHMHYFYFKVWIEVNHTNRDIEFIQLRRWLEGLYNTGALEMDNKSCEMLSDDLYLRICDKYPDVAVLIDISEDNINGSFTRYGTEKDLL